MSDALTDAAQAVVQISKWTAVRDQSIRDAATAGKGLREIGRAVSMSPTGVSKIIARTPQR